MKRAKRRPLYLNPWRPVGYYKNRPRLLARFAAAGLGRLESVSFIHSAPDPFGIRYKSKMACGPSGGVILNDDWMTKFKR